MIRTDFFHRSCGTWLFTRNGPPYSSGERVGTEDVVGPDAFPLPESAFTLKCPCRRPINFSNEALKYRTYDDGA